MAQLSVNLYELIKQNRFQGLSCTLIRTIIAQLLEAMTVSHRASGGLTKWCVACASQVLKEARIIHCDLKPENVLLEK